MPRSPVNILPESSGLGRFCDHGTLSRPTADRSPQGFTIIELLAATAVFVLMITLLLSAVSQINQAWRTSDGQKARRESARALLDLMARDLQGALAPLASSGTGTMNFALNPQGGPVQADAFFLRTSAPADRSKSDVATVGYYVDPTTKSLCRYYTNTITGIDLTGAAAAARAALPNQANDFKGLVADGVFGMFVTLLKPDGSSEAISGTQWQSNRPPASVEVALVIGDKRSVETNAGYVPAWNTKSEDLKPGLQWFRTRVEIPAGQ